MMLSCYEIVDGDISCTRVLSNLVTLGSVSPQLSTYIVDNLNIDNVTVKLGLGGIGVLIYGSVYEEYKGELVRVIRCGKEAMSRVVFEYKRSLVTDYANMG